MNEKIENVVEEPDVWKEFDKEMDSGSKYLSFDAGKGYRITISAADPKKSDKFLDKDGQPKQQMNIVVATVNGQPCGKLWITASWTVMREVRQAVKDGTLTHSVFFLKKKIEGDKKSYVFEKIEQLNAPVYNSTELKSPVQTQKSEDTEAFL